MAADVRIGIEKLTCFCMFNVSVKTRRGIFGGGGVFCLTGTERDLGAALVEQRDSSRPRRMNGRRVSLWC